MLMRIQLLVAGPSLFSIQLFFRYSPDQQPNDDTEQRAEKGGDEVLECDVDFGKVEIDVE